MAKRPIRGGGRSTSRGRRDERRGGKRGKRRSRYGSTKDQTKRKTKETKGGGKYAWWVPPDGVEQWKPEKKGRYRMDIVPYIVKCDTHDVVEKGGISNERTVLVHRGVGVDEKMVVCLRTIGAPCPICEGIIRMTKRGEITDKEAKAMAAKSRQLFNVLIDGDIKIFESSVHTFGKKLYSEIDETYGETGVDYAGFADLEDGATLLARFVDASFGGNSFLELDRVDFKDRKDMSEDILDETHDLDKCLIIYDYDELNKIFLEQGGGDDDDDDDEGRSRGRSRRSRGGGKGKGKSSRRGRGKRCPEGGIYGEEFGVYDYCVGCEEQEECAYKSGVDMDDDVDDYDDDDVDDYDDDDDDDDDDYDDNDDDDYDDNDDGVEKCPYGLVWGEDNETDPDCDDCRRWERCNLEKQRLDSKSRRGKKKSSTRGKKRGRTEERRRSPSRGSGKRKVVKKRSRR